ncbi:MAG: 2-oxoacid:ferredoxin oxidoreductase subunit beta [Candidatus Zixiibacteriota bacterium]|nr:MAG: 2-oxoacid:ferredoxin oxidoreductase subunit beta [candidate division Zixibacteria bacterium]
MSEPRHRLMDFVREEIMPHRFCSGCGCGTVLNAFTNAVEGLGLDSAEMVCVSGIGCSSWIPSPYFRADTLHTTHGRPIAFATGVKILRPDLTVVVIAGDGDVAGIGGNHLIHAARRNIDLSVFMVNNMIYGMTGGQVAPTTPAGVVTTTTPHSNVEPPFRVADLVVAAGASYVARWTTYHVFPLLESMQNAIKRKGFSFIEIMSQCPENYGRRIGLRTGIDFLKQFKEQALRVEKANGMSEEELKDRIVIGKLCDKERPEYVSELHRITREQVDKLKKEMGGAA